MTEPFKIRVFRYDPMVMKSPVSKSTVWKTIIKG